ncbi:MAG: hypothetical protein MUE30_15425 [Spirosomaceae bacterium]|nr:hypothetical protein [Spirosomataceae bacterium]
MKQTLQRYFTVLMAMLVLVASTGFGVVEHRCIMRGKSLHLAAFEKKDCHGCHEKHAKTPLSNQTSVQKKSCCDDQQRYQHVETSSSVTQYVAKFIKATADAVFHVAVATFKTLTRALVDAFSPSASTSSLSSLLHGRSLLTWIQSFLI